VPLNTADRAAHTQAVLDEFTAWNPRQRTDMFRRWLTGSLSVVHLYVLTVLESDGALPMGKIAEALDVSVASTTGIIDRMEQRGLVERGQDPDDRRVVLVRPTAAGLRVFSDLDELRHSTIARILEHLDDDELTALLKGIRAMNAARVALAAAAETALAEAAT
jgi:DNA-binding MarR family transcriptional regulator